MDLGWVNYNRRETNRTNAFMSIQTIREAQEVYNERHGEFAPDFKYLISANLSPIPETAEEVGDSQYKYSGYIYMMHAETPGHWEAEAWPALPGKTGIAYWYLSGNDEAPRLEFYERANKDSYQFWTGEGKSPNEYNIVDKLELLEPQKPFITGVIFIVIGIVMLAIYFKRFDKRNNR
jgi:hypothetical protein